MITKFYFGETDLDAADVAEIAGMTTERIEGIFGPGVIATVNVSGDEDPMRPDEWDLGDESWAVFHLSDDYVFKSQIGDDVPSGLENAVDTWLNVGRDRWRHRGTDYAVRVVERYAALIGYEVKLVTLHGYNEWAEMLIAVPKSTENAAGVIDAIHSEWQTYFGQEVYVANVEMASPLLDGVDLFEACGGLYGDGAVQDFATEMILYGVRSIIAEITEVRAA